MSTITIYDTSVGVFIGATKVLAGILKKAMDDPNADSFPSASLIDDMKPLNFHVESVLKTVSRALDKLGIDFSPAEEKEATMQQLLDRTENALRELESIDPKALDGKEAATVAMPGQSGNVTGKQFVLGLALPNVFFHLQTTYAILRMKGVPLGKADYLGCWMRP